MRSIIAWFIKYPIWSNVLLFGLLLFGFLSLRQMRSSFFPETEPNMVAVVIAWPGASPEEIEEGAVQRIEENLRGLEGVSITTSVSRENTATITVEISDGANVDKVTEDVKAAVDRVAPWPESAEKPIVKSAAFRMRALSIAVHGKNTDRWVLKDKAQAFRDALFATGKISQVNISGFPSREIVIEVQQQALDRYQLTLSDISNAVQSANLDLSGGKIQTAHEEILIRTYNRENDADLIRRIPVRLLSNGDVLRLDQLAKVEERFEDSPDRYTLNGQPAVSIDIEQTNAENILEVANETKAILKNWNQKYPGVQFTIVEDPTITLQGRIDLLVTNGIQGFILVVLALTLFLSWRLSFWVAIGIPTSLAGMFIVIRLWGITINVLSLLGMIIVIGMLVDDAIVTAENIYQKFEKGASASVAAIDGAMNIAAPIFSSVMTTILAFLPFFFFAGAMGNMVWQLALVVIAALVFSFIESMFILPPHLAHSKALVKKDRKTLVRAKLDQFQEFLSNKIYGKALAWSLERYWAILFIPLAAFLLTRGMMAGGFIQTSDFPHIDGDDVRLSITMVAGTPDHVTDSVLMDIEQIVWDINQELKNKRNDKKDVILAISRKIGSNSLGDQGGHAGSLAIKLLPAEERNLKSHVVSTKLRQKLGPVAGLQKFSFAMGHWGRPISISLISNDLHQLDKAKQIIKAKMAEIPDIKDVVDNDVEGLREFRLKLTPTGWALGFTPRTLALQVRQGFFGQEIQRLQRGEDEIRVWARLAERDRNRISALEELKLTSPSGKRIALKEVATWEMDRGRVAINHMNGKREVRIEADMANPDASPQEVKALIKSEIIPEALAQVQNVTTGISGQDRQNQLFFKSVQTVFPPALIAIFILLVLMHRSVAQASIIIGMIPLGLIGSIWGHWIHDLMISRMSMFGMVALSGIVINNSIVLIEKINENLVQGLPLRDAVFKGSVSRLRPMILTTFTTVLGLMPIILEKSMQAQFLIPMAATVAYGLLGGTLFILFVTPSAFLALNAFRLFRARIWMQVRALWSGDYSHVRPITPEEVEPAVIEKKHESMEAWS